MRKNYRTSILGVGKEKQPLDDNRRPRERKYSLGLKKTREEAVMGTSENKPSLLITVILSHAHIRLATILAFLALMGAVSLLSPSTAQAIPILNPHPHALVGFEDPAGGGPGVNHHHWDPLFPLYPGNGVANDETANSPIASIGKPFVNVAFDAYSAWDQRGGQALYRNGDAIVNFGHGFISGSVPYSFEGGMNGVPMAAMMDINNAFTRWETQATAQFAIDPFGAGTGRVFGMNFNQGAAEDMNFNGVLDLGEDANMNGLLDGFAIEWVEGGIVDAFAQWIPGSQVLQFDGTVPWFFGGAGIIPVGKTDFFTIGMHEIGHVIGLNHINTGVANNIMREDIRVQATAAGSMGLRNADVGSLFGTLALYTQPIPEPSTIVLFGIGLTAMAFFRWRNWRKRNP